MPEIENGSALNVGVPATPMAMPAAVAAPAVADAHTPAPSAGAPASPAAGASPQRVSLTQSEFKDRLARAKAAALREAFGTEDVSNIRERLGRAEALEKQAEAQKLAQMSEIERMKYELNRSRKSVDQYRAQLEEVREGEVVRSQQSSIEKIATRHINPLYVEEASYAFAADISGRDPREVAKWGEKEIANWFAKYAARKPALAASTKARTQRRDPVGAPSAAPRPTNPASGSPNGGKTFKPGMQNSMTAAEAKDAAKRLGLQW